MQRPPFTYLQGGLALVLALAPLMLRGDDEAVFSKEDSLAFARALAGTKDLSELDLNIRRYLIPQFAPRLAAACETDPALGEQAVRRAVQLFAAAQEKRKVANEFDEGNGNNFASMLISRIGELQPGFSTMRVAWRLYLHDLSAQFGHSSWPNLGGWDKTMFDAFEKGDGWNDRRAGLRAVLGPLRQVIGTDPPGLLLTGFAGFANKLDPWELVVVREAADQLAQSQDPEAPLAKVLSAALRLARFKLLTTLPTKPDETWLKDNGAWLQELRSLAGDPKIPELNRFAIAAQLVRDLAPLRDSAMIRIGMEAGTRALEWDQPTNGYGWEPLLTAFNSLPLDDSWRRLAERFHRAWLHRCRFESEVPGSLHRFGPFSGVSSLALETVARLGNPTDFKAFAKLHRLTSTQVFVLMVRHGFHEAAAEWLHETPPRRVSEKISGLNFRSGDQDAVDRFCATLHQPDYELLARIHVANNPPSDDGVPRLGKDSLPPRWDARMAALVPAFFATNFESPKVRDACLYLLSDSPSAAILLHEEIAKSPLRNPIFGRNPSSQQIGDALRVASGYIGNGFAVGNSSPFENTLRALGGLVTSTNDWRYTTSVSFLIGEIQEAALLLAPECDAAGLKRWRDGIDAALDLFQSNQSSDSLALAAITQAVFHSLTGSAGELEKRRAALPEEKRAVYLEAIKAHRGDLAGVVSAFCRQNADGLRSIDERKMILLLFLNDPWIRPRISNLPTLLTSLVKKKVFTSSELLEFRTEIEAADKGNGRRARELAALAWEAGRKDWVTELLNQAAEENSSKTLKDRYRLAERELR